jgi:hypothetical protein
LHYERPERNAAGAITDYVHVQKPEVLVSNEWCHVAVVARTNSAKLYFNGGLVQTDEVRFDWRPNSEPEHRNYLGRDVMRAVRNAGESDFDGQMTEIRLWAGERTPANPSQPLERPHGPGTGFAGAVEFQRWHRQRCVAAGLHGKLMGKPKS